MNDCPICARLCQLGRSEREVFDLVADDSESDRPTLLRGMWQSWGFGDVPAQWFVDHIDDCDQ